VAKDYKGIGVVERDLCFSNKMMLDRVTLMHKILSMKVPKKVRMGNKSIMTEELKYKNSAHLIKTMEDSIEYYKNLHEEEMSNTFELRDYQQDIVDRATKIINVNRFVYLAMEVRTGKTLTSLSICDNLDSVDNVLFITKKKAIKTITEDSDKICPSYSLFVINYESLQK
jgi:hypothetical protein